MTDRADDGPPSTETLIDQVNATPGPDGISVDASADPGPVGGAWRTDIAGQLLQAVGVGFQAAVGIEQALSKEVFGKIAWGPHAAMRVGDWTVGIPHMHAPIAPWPPFGPFFRGIPAPVPGQVLDMGFLSGAATVTINRMPAARCGDMGVHIPLCLSFLPFFEIFFGSATVWIESQRAARTLDPTLHCILCDPPTLPPKIAPGISVGPGSGNVFIGGVPLPSLVDFAVGMAVKGLTGAAKRLGRLARLNRLKRFLPRLPGRLGSWLNDEIAAWQRRLQAARASRLAGDAVEEAVEEAAERAPKVVPFEEAYEVAQQILDSNDVLKEIRDMLDDFDNLQPGQIDDFLERFQQAAKQNGLDVHFVPMDSDVPAGLGIPLDDVNPGRWANDPANGVNALYFAEELLDDPERLLQEVSHEYGAVSIANHYGGGKEAIPWIGTIDPATGEPIRGAAAVTHMLDSLISG